MPTGRVTAPAERENPAAGVAPAQPRSEAEVPQGPSDARPEPYGEHVQASPDEQPSIVPLLLEQLTPQCMSALLGRTNSCKQDSWAIFKRIEPIFKRIKAAIFKPIKPIFKPIKPMIRFVLGFEPKTRLVLIGLAATAIFFCLAYADGGLTSPARIPTAIGLIIHPVPKPAQVSLPLLQDPVGLIVIVMTLVTPILLAQQVHAIGVFNETNERNIDYRSKRLSDGKINREVGRANTWFRRIGSRRWSVGILAGSALASYGVDVLFHRWGLFSNWNRTELSSATWRRRVYIGWWANPDHHFLLAVALWALGCYFFYFVTKQVWMGALFAIYIQRIKALEFGVSPNMRANVDGLWGLSEVRGFMLATYTSSLCHTLMIVGILIIWLPFNAFTLLMIALVTIINAVEVIYPTRVGHVGAVKEKVYYVRHLLGKDARQPSQDQVQQVQAVWDRPLLPFRVRSTLTTVTVSLLFPLVLALASRLIGG